MDITTIIELENKEVEKILDAKIIFEKEKVNEYIIHTCVSGFIDNVSEDILQIDVAMEKLFMYLKEDGYVPAGLEDFSYELPSCDRIKNTAGVDDIPQKVMISFIIEK
jgi:hypothetical protein